MKPDQERVKNLLTDTVTLLCKNGLHYNKELKVQGLLGITLDENEVFVVHINEKFGDLVASSGIIVQADDTESASQMAIKTAALMRMSGAKSSRAHEDSSDGEHPRKRSEKRRRPSREGASSKPASPGSSRSDSLSASGKSLEGFTQKDDSVDLADVKIKKERLDDEVICVGGHGETDIPGSGDDRNAMQETYSNPLSDLQSGVAQLEQIASSMDPALGGSGLDTGVPPAKRKGLMPQASSADQLGNLGPFITGMMRNQQQSSGANSSASDLSQWDNSAFSGMGHAGDSSSGDVAPGCSTWDPSQMAARSSQGDDSRLGNLSLMYPGLQHLVSTERRPRDSVDKGHICPLPNCGKRFFQISSLRRHQTLKHGRLKTPRRSELNDITLPLP